MKNLLCLLLLIFSFVFSVNTIVAAPQQTEQMDFSTVISNNKPALILLYASWADDASICLQQFNSLKNVFTDKFNYVLLDITSEDMKSFNKNYLLQPNIPYLMMSKAKGKIIRYMPKECIKDNACLMQKVNSFAN